MDEIENFSNIIYIRCAFIAGTAVIRIQAREQ